MCLHPISRGLDKLDREVYSIEESLDEFDTCDYVKGQFSITANDLCIVQLNIQGICTKQSGLKQLINNCIEGRTPDIVIICETWLTPFSPSIKIPGNEFCHKDRTSKRGGGVALLILNRLRFKIHENVQCPTTTFEEITAEISLKSGQKLIVSSFYRPPNTPENDFVDQYSNFICKLKKLDQQGIIIGLDHNLDLFKSLKHGPTDQFLSTNLSLNLVPTITRPSRITKSTATLIIIFLSDSLGLEITIVVY